MGFGLMNDYYNDDDDYEHDPELTKWYSAQDLELAVNNITGHCGCSITQIGDYDLFSVKFNDDTIIEVRWIMHSCRTFMEDLANEIVLAYYKKLDLV